MLKLKDFNFVPSIVLAFSTCFFFYIFLILNMPVLIICISFISICIVLLIVMNPEYNALIIRKTANTLRRSVFEQIVWAINILGLSGKFRIPRSSTAALPITYTRKNGVTQSIIFAGRDDPEKIKSILLVKNM